MDNNQGALFFTAGIDRTKWKEDIDKMRSEIFGIEKTANSANIDFGINKENLAIQKQVIAEIKKNIAEIEKEASKMAPGMAQASVLGQVGPLKTELAAEEKALAGLEAEMKKTAVTATTLSTKYNEAKNRLAELNLVNKQGTVEYATAEAEVKKYGIALSDANARAKALTAGTIGSLAQGLSLITGTMAMATSLMGAYGGKNEELNQIMVKSQALLAATVTLQEIKNTTVQKGGIISGIMAVQEYARARAADAAALASGRATIAQRAWNLVANANPYVLLASAILSVVGAIGLYVIATNQAEAKTKSLIDLNKNIADSVAEPLVAYRNLQGQWNALGNDLKAKEKFIKDNAKEFNKLSVEVKGVSDAENVLVRNTSAFVQSMMLKAKATAMQQKAVEDTRKSLELEAEYRRKYIDKDLTAGEKLLMPTQAAARSYAKSDAEEIRKLNQGIYNDSLKQLDVEKQIAEIRNKSGFKTPEKEVKEATKKTVNTGKPKPLNADDILPPGSVAEIQKRMAEIDKALSKATNDESIKLLKARRVKVALELTAAEKKIRIQSFNDEMAEIKKQIELRDKLLQNGYSKESVDGMLPKVKDKSYIGYLEETENALKRLRDAGDNTEETANNLIIVQDAISEFKGYSTFIDNVANSLEKLKSKFSGDDLIREFEKFKNFQVPGATETESNARKLAAEKAIEAENKAIEEKQQQFYDDFLKEKETFEQKKLAIDQKYNSIDATINGSDNSADEKARLLAESGKARGEEYSNAFLEAFKNTDLWKRAFADIATLTQREINALIPQLQQQLSNLLKNNGSASDIKVLKDRIKELQGLGSTNPFKVLEASLKVINDETATTAEKFEGIKAGFQAAGEAVMIIGDSFGGFDDATNDAIGNIMAIGSAALDLGKSIATGDVAGMIKAGLQLIGSIGKALSGDQKKERAIKKQAAAVQELERTYESLAKAIDKAMGEGVFSASQEAINNLKQQKALIEQMMLTEQSKKKVDKNKINDFKEQINSINSTIEDLQESLIDKVLNGVDARGLADKLSDALTTAFANGEDAAQAMGRTVDEVLRDMVKNALKMKILEPAMQGVVDKMLASMGYGAKPLEDQIQNRLSNLQKQLNSAKDNKTKANLEKQIADLKLELQRVKTLGSFDGLTDAEREELKKMMLDASTNYTNALKEYEGLFGTVAGDAQGLKADIKGVTEQTAGALEGQINAMRVNQVENMGVLRSSLLQLSQIEQNTRPIAGIHTGIIGMQKGIDDLNSKFSKNPLKSVGL